MDAIINHVHVASIVKERFGYYSQAFYYGDMLSVSECDLLPFFVSVYGALSSIKIEGGTQ